MEQNYFKFSFSQLMNYVTLDSPPLYYSFCFFLNVSVSFPLPLFSLFLFVSLSQWECFFIAIYDLYFSYMRAQRPNAQCMDYHDLRTKLYSPWGFTHDTMICSHKHTKTILCMLCSTSLKQPSLGFKLGNLSTTQN